MSLESSGRTPGRLSLWEQCRRVADIHMWTLGQVWGFHARALLLFFLPLPPLLFLGLSSNRILETFEVARLIHERGAFLSCAGIYFLLAFGGSATTCQVANALRWSLPLRRGLPTVLQLVPWGIAWSLLLLPLWALFPSGAGSIGLPVLFLGWMALPLALLHSTRFEVDRRVFASWTIWLAGMILVGVQVVGASPVSQGSLVLLLASLAVLLWGWALQHARTGELLPQGIATVVCTADAGRSPTGRSPLVSLYRAMLGPLWIWAIAASVVTALLPFAGPRTWRFLSVLFAMPGYFILVSPLLARSSIGHALCFAVPRDRSRLFFLVHAPVLPFVFLLSTAWVYLAGVVSIELRPERPSESRAGVPAIVEFRSRGVSANHRGQSTRRLRAGSVRELSVGLADALAGDWGYRVEAADVENAVAEFWDGRPLGSLDPVAFESALGAIAQDFTSKARLAGRVQAILVVLAGTLLFGLYFLVDRRPGGAALASYIAAGVALTGFLLFLMVFYLGIGSPLMRAACERITMAFLRGWWAFLLAWLAGVRWLWIRCRGNFVAMDMEDVERHITGRGGLIHRF